MAISTSLEPLPAGQFGYLQAQHLLNRAGFGGTPQQVLQLQELGLDKAVDLLVNYPAIDTSNLPRPEYDPDIIRPATPEERAMAVKARREGDQATLDRLMAERLERQAADRRQMRELERWWLAKMIQTPRPLEEKLVLLWHGHFAANHRTVGDSYLMLQQNAMFRQHACGSFANLAAGIVRDPAMLVFLNNTQNRRQRPNENLARELMELFTLGEGQYSEQDIKEGARALTGYFVDDNDFVFRRGQHDDGPKKILGRTGTFDGDEFVNILLRHPACPRFIAYKLYRHFVLDLSDGVRSTPEAAAVIERMARDLAAGGYQIAPVLRKLFKSRHFYDPAVMGRKVKTPAELVVGVVRTLGAPVRDVGMLADAMAAMGQKLFDPPSVAGWDYGKAWINTSTLFTRQNICTYVITGKLPFEDGWSRERIGFDPRTLIEHLTNPMPEAIVDHLIASLLGSAAVGGAERRQQLVQFMRQRSDPTSEDALIALLLLITTLPEYQLC